VRRDEIYFAMITLGFGMMLYTVAHNWFALTGGSDGLPVMNLPPLNVLGGQYSLFDPTAMYLFVFSVIAVCIFFLWRVVRSPFGLMLTAIRENKQRLSFVGAGVQNLRLTAFVIAGAVAGIAGGLFCLFNAMATPDITALGVFRTPGAHDRARRFRHLFRPPVRGGDLLRSGTVDHRFDGKLDDLPGDDPDTGGDLFSPRHFGHADTLDSNKDKRRTR
jgi:hypothetical protein